MRYYATASGPTVREAITGGLLGLITTPHKSSPPWPAVSAWCADNACFTGHYPGDEAYLAWLTRLGAHAPACAFATAPDVLGDATATLTRSAPMFARIRAAGYPAALVAQDGLEHLPVPWSDFDCLFLGGSTEWKLSTAAADLAATAQSLGKQVHMGRVNSRRRLRHANAIGCHSADGTFLAYGPSHNLPKLLAWLTELTPTTSQPAPTQSPMAIGATHTASEKPDDHP